MSVFARLVLKTGAGLHRLRSFSSLSSLAQISADSVKGNNSLLINNGTEIFSSTISPRDGAIVVNKSNLSYPIEVEGKGEEGPFFVVGPCNGQYCIYSGWKGVSLFNPATGDITNFTFPLWKEFFLADVHSLGFGYDSKINDFKIVRSITCDFWNHRINLRDLSYQGRKTNYIEVISLGSMERRELPVLGEIRARIPSLSGVPNVDGVCYWSCKDYHYNKAKVMSFNFADEVFDVFTLPPCDYLNYNPETEDCLMEVFNGLPAAIRYHASPDKFFEVWVKKETWIKEMCIGPISYVIKPLCFWNNGKGLLLLDSEYQLVSYDFCTKQVKKLNIQLAEPIKSEGRTKPIIQVLNLPRRA